MFKRDEEIREGLLLHLLLLLLLQGTFCLVNSGETILWTIPTPLVGTPDCTLGEETPLLLLLHLLLHLLLLMIHLERRAYLGLSLVFLLLLLLLLYRRCCCALAVSAGRADAGCCWGPHPPSGVAAAAVGGPRCSRRFCCSGGDTAAARGSSSCCCRSSSRAAAICAAADATAAPAAAAAAAAAGSSREGFSSVDPQDRRYFTLNPRPNKKHLHRESLLRNPKSHWQPCPFLVSPRCF